MTDSTKTSGRAQDVSTIITDASRSLAGGPRTRPADVLQKLGAALETLRDLPRARLADRVHLDEFAALADGLVALLEDGAAEDRERACRCAWRLLDVLRLPAVLLRINEARAVDPWMDRMVALVDASHFTVFRLLRQRVDQYGARTLFRTLAPGRGQRWSWLEVAAQVDRIARGLLALFGRDADQRVAILSENRPEMIFLDLACLSLGLVDVMIPTGSTETDVAFILGHARATAAIVSNEQQLAKVLRQRGALDRLKHVIVMDDVFPQPMDVKTLEEVAGLAAAVRSSEVEQRGSAVLPGDLATVMYTSGTTGVPKGIMFSQRNIVIKRFARALALPEIGEKDMFLSFLPLCHTFGRYLEMLGAIFWGATYAFVESTAPKVLVANMQKVRPTIFISIPLKWMELYERIARDVDLETAADADIAAATARITGGRLRFGLSAAGYLDPDIFRFFQRQGIELMSGFGMTETTGGAIMTPPGQYQENSLGLPLPGIETRLAEDGELQVRGPYVMIGYLDPDEGGSGLEDGWLRTGDIMELDGLGHFRIVDRKKEIYKNTRGETIAPQRVENLFRDFEEVKRVFLVGDHREYNTALILPNLDCTGVDLRGMSEEERHAYFRSQVVSVNSFLAPFERITDFILIDRDFSEERGELTKKNTYRRQQIERNFREVIDRLYEQHDLRLTIDELELRISRRLLQTLGLTAREFYVDKSELVLRSTGARLGIRKVRVRGAEVEVVVGAGRYRLTRPRIEVERFLMTPALWLGNEELARFVDLEPAQRRRRQRSVQDAQWLGRARALPDPGRLRAELSERAEGHHVDLGDVHRAAQVIEGGRDRDGLVGLDVIEVAATDAKDYLAEPARVVLRRAAQLKSATIRRRAVQILAPCEGPVEFGAMLESYAQRLDVLLDSETVEFLCQHGLEDAKLKPFFELVERVARPHRVATPPLELRSALALLRFLSAYGMTHPAKFETVRFRLIQTEVLAPSPKLRKEAGRQLMVLIEGFRRWLGQNHVIAVDSETGKEYRWDDVITIEEGVDAEEAELLLRAIKESTLIRESIFLFSGGDVPRLKDIPPGGIWVSHLTAKHGKSLYRVTVHTRHRESHDFALNLNKDLDPRSVAAELNWRVLTSEPRHGHMLVERLGGFWAEFGLWSEEYASVDTVRRSLRRLNRARSEEGRQRMRQSWPYLAWNGLAAYFDFWDRTERVEILNNPTPGNVIVPIRDYHTHTRIISISDRGPFAGLVPMMAEMWEQFVRPVELQYENLAGLATADVLFAGLLEVVGESEGRALLTRALAEAPCAGEPAWLRGSMREYLEKLAIRGFRPSRLHFAIGRYHRWAALNPEAEPQAKAATIQELYDTYLLERLAWRCPEVRIRFFRDTVFAAAREPIAQGIDGIIERMRERRIDSEELIDLVSALRTGPELTPDEDYFLTRLSYPYLRPEDAADFISSAATGHQETDIVVTLEDDRGNVYQVRRAMNPKEVGRLHRQFLKSRMEVSFGPNDHFLVAISDRGALIGGLLYEIDEDGESARFGTIVVADRYRKGGVSTGLMTEFFNRMKAAGVKTITTGFFRPEYFYGFGFRIERKYAGLVKVL